MRIAVEGCAHGELDYIYSAIRVLEEKEKKKVDLLICCGDFQASRNTEDLACMAVPPKYRHICSFYKYFSGEMKAPVLTIFIGGNHEASNYLQELPYGGWVAPNIYYLGYAGVINIAGIRIGGLSGIYKGRDFLKGRYEKVPYDENSKRSVYHVRNLEVFRLKQISKPIDIFLSHDWPTGVYNYGDVKQLLKRKPFFRDEIETNQLGSKPCEELLRKLQPKQWCSAHLHCRFTASVPHDQNTCTKFLALDKCLPRRQFLEIIEVPHDTEKQIEIEYDLEWLSILYLTNHLLNVKNTTTYMPGPGSSERYNFTPSEEEQAFVLKKMHDSLKIPKNFRPTAVAYQQGSPVKNSNRQPPAKLNPQTVELCGLLNIDDPICLLSESQGLNISLDSSFLENSTFIIDSDESVNDSDSKVMGSEEEYKSEEEERSKAKVMTPMKLPVPRAESTPENFSSIKNGDKQRTENTSDDGDSAQESPLFFIDVVPTPEPKQKDLSAIAEEMRTPSPKRTFDSETTRNDPEQLTSFSGASESSSTEVITITPTHKKFKRRNASIYSSENTES